MQRLLTAMQQQQDTAGVEHEDWSAEFLAQCGTGGGSSVHVESLQGVPGLTKGELEDELTNRVRIQDKVTIDEKVYHNVSFRPTHVPLVPESAPPINKGDAAWTNLVKQCGLLFGMVLMLWKRFFAR